MINLPLARILTCHYTHCAPDWMWDSRNTHWHSLILWCVTAGRGTLDTMERRFDLRAGDCFVLRMWHRVIGRHDPASPLSVLWAHFSYENPRGDEMPLTDADALPALHRRLSDPSFFGTLFERAIEQVQADGENTPAANRWMNATMLELARQDELTHLHGPQRNQAEAVRSLCARIREKPGQPWSVAEMAGELHCSPDHFRRVFRRWAGMNPARFVIQARTDAARSLLGLSSHTVSEIADRLGYVDVYHFSRQFKQVTGVSPSGYRRG